MTGRAPAQSFSFLLLSLGLESASAYALFAPPESVELYGILACVVLHACAAWAATEAGRRLSAEKGQSLLYFLAAFFFYPVGVPGIGILHLIRMARPDRLSKGVMADYLSEIDVEVDLEDELGRIESIESEIQKQLHIQPLVDHILGKNIMLKRAAAKKLGSIANLDAVRMLRMLLRDRDREVRFYATTSLERIDETYNSHIRSLKEQISSAPENPALNRELGHAYLDYVDVGLLDAVSEKFCMDLAAEAFQKALGQEENPGTLLYLAIIDIRMGRTAEAERRLNRTIELNPGLKEAYFRRAEIHFLRGQIDGVAGECTRAEGAAELDVEARQVVQWWAGTLETGAKG